MRHFLGHFLEKTNICHVRFSFLTAQNIKVPKNSSEKWRRKLHIKFRRFRLNIRTSVIRNDFLLSRSILAAAFVLEEITLSSELCFPKIGKIFFQ